METIDHVKEGGFESWIVHWTATADRVSAVAEREPFEHFAQALGRGDLWSLA